MLPDPWLDRWLPVIARHSQDASVLELGCGSGHDTATLTAAGFSVTTYSVITAVAQPNRQDASWSRHRSSPRSTNKIGV